MSTHSATSPVDDWKETKGSAQKLLPENYEKQEDFIIDMARAFFDPSFLLMRTEAGRKLELHELEETLTNPFLSSKDKEAIKEFAPNICAYIQNVIEEMIPGEPHPEFNNLDDKHDTELRDLNFKKLVFERMHEKISARIIDQDINFRQEKDIKARRITAQDITVHDIIKERYPDLYDDHILTLVPYMQEALATNHFFAFKAKFIKEAREITAKLGSSASSDPS